MLIAKCKEEKKPEQIIEKIVNGQIKKWESEKCLLLQTYVKNPDLTIEEYLKNTIAKLGENIVIRGFVRLEIGAGIEKKQENFAEEERAPINN